MVRSSQATTFSSSPYFFDRGVHGTAQPITERINVNFSDFSLCPNFNYQIIAAFPSNRVLLLSKRCWSSTLWSTCNPIRRFVNHLKPIPLNLQERHPMKPHRLTLTNALVMGYGLDKQIHHIYDPRPATQEELENYHDHDYIEFLSKSVAMKKV